MLNHWSLSLLEEDPKSTLVAIFAKEQKEIPEQS